MPDVRTTDSVWQSRPWPDADDLTRPYWDNAAAGRLCMMKCTSCGTFRHPPTQSCESCGSDASEWVALSGAGTVYSFIVDERNMMAGFDGPYVVAMVTPAEFADGGPGPWIIANITGCDVRDVRIGMPVQVWFEPTAREGVALPQFAPSQGTLDRDN